MLFINSKKPEKFLSAFERVGACRRKGEQAAEFFSGKARHGRPDKGSRAVLVCLFLRAFGQIMPFAQSITSLQTVSKHLLSLRISCLAPS